MTRITRFTSALTFIAVVAVSPSLASAQFWHAMPSVTGDKSVDANFSQDEKNVYYLSSEQDVANVWKVPIKGGAAVQVTKFTDHPVVRFFHLINRPEIVYMRSTNDAGTDFHIYRIADDGTGTPQDLTGGGPGVSAEIIGASYNGRYIYYTSNKVSKDKIDTYRYDTQQYISEVVFPNDKDYKTLGWSRDHNRLLVEDPESGELMMFDINTTERTPLAKPSSGHFSNAIMDPTNHDLLVIEKPEDAASTKVYDFANRNWQPLSAISSEPWKSLANGELSSVDFSPNGKYVIAKNGAAWSVKDASTGADIALPAGATPVSIAPKETLMLYALPNPDGSQKLFVYDFGKKTSVEVGTVKN